MRCRIFLFTLVFFSWMQPACAEEKTFRIYHDADWSNHMESAQAIWRGLELALSEVENKVQGYRIELVKKDHRGNVVLSMQNYKAFLEDPQALAIYSGIHSPPLIKNRDFINENKALTLVPWAAGGPITRYPSKENWIFRLSVDDMHAGPVIVDYAMKRKSCERPALLLEKTPWGDSNLKTMGGYLKQQGVENPHVVRFGWNLTKKSARVILRQIIEEKSDCVVLVANAIEGVEISAAMIELPEKMRIPIISHWGITGGNFHKTIGARDRNKIDLNFIQSCFSFTNPELQDSFSKDVFRRLAARYPNDIQNPKDVSAAVGFIHSYDLTRLFIQALHEIKLSGNIDVDRDALRRALENLQTPVRGLVKTYEAPFSVFDPEDNVNAHEALGTENYCMGRYGNKNEVIVDRRAH